MGQATIRCIIALSLAVLVNIILTLLSALDLSYTSKLYLAFTYTLFVIVCIRGRRRSRTVIFDLISLIMLYFFLTSPLNIMCFNSYSASNYGNEEAFLISGLLVSNIMAIIALVNLIAPAYVSMLEESPPDVKVMLFLFRTKKLKSKILVNFLVIFSIMLLANLLDSFLGTQSITYYVQVVLFMLIFNLDFLLTGVITYPIIALVKGDYWSYVVSGSTFPLVLMLGLSIGTAVASFLTIAYLNVQYGRFFHKFGVFLSLRHAMVLLGISMMVFIPFFFLMSSDLFVVIYFVFFLFFLSIQVLIMIPLFTQVSFNAMARCNLQLYGFLLPQLLLLGIISKFFSPYVNIEADTLHKLYFILIQPVQLLAPYVLLQYYSINRKLEVSSSLARILTFIAASAFPCLILSFLGGCVSIPPDVSMILQALMGEDIGALCYKDIFNFSIATFSPIIMSLLKIIKPSIPLNPFSLIFFYFGGRDVWFLSIIAMTIKYIILKVEGVKKFRERAAIVIIATTISVSIINSVTFLIGR